MLELAQEVAGLAVEERVIGLPEVLEAQAEGSLLEMFGTGTAATITSVASLRFQDRNLAVPVPRRSLAASLSARLQDIYYGREEHSWAEEVTESGLEQRGEECQDTRALKA